jgi:hypothetical protein
MGYALVLDVGAGAHFTVTWFKTSKISKANLRVILLVAQAFCYSQKIETVPLERGIMWGRNSVFVFGGLALLKKQLTEYFVSLGFDDIDTNERATTPHINIKGNRDIKLNPQINVIDSFYII